METTAKPTVDLITLADAVRKDLRALLSAWCAQHPDQLVMTVSISDITSLAPATHEQASRALAQLETYVGAPLTAQESKTPIPHKYAIHPNTAVGVIEVHLIPDS